jgi:cell division protein FtsQ
MIGRDSFWHAQVTQIEVQPDQTFVLIPLFGDQRILIGDTANVQEKLKHLFAFYKNVSGKIGWDKYETLDVRYKNQVVASPSIGWIPPKATDTTTTIIEGPDPKADVHTVAAVKPVVAKPAVQTARPVVSAIAKQKPTLKPAVAKQNIVKAKPATAKPKSTVQASSKPKDKKKETTTNKDKTKTQSPKYIYPGKHSGNH